MAAGLRSSQQKGKNHKRTIQEKHGDPVGSSHRRLGAARRQCGYRTNDIDRLWFSSPQLAVVDSLAQGGDGKLYCVTYTGGPDSGGTFFRMSVSGRFRFSTTSDCGR